MNSQLPSFEVTSDDKLWAGLAYLLSPLVPIIILLMQDKKTRPFIRAHNVQALVVGIIVSILATVLTAICIGPFLWLINVWLAVLAYQGKVFEIPVVTNFVKQQGWA
jgi:uncharacterized protein